MVKLIMVWPVKLATVPKVSWTEASDVRQTTVTGLAATASDGVFASTPPCATRASALEAVRFHIVTWYPPLMNICAMDVPMLPRPMTETGPVGGGAELLDMLTLLESLIKILGGN